MKKIISRITAVILSAGLTAAALTGCGNKKPEKQDAGSYSLVLGASGDSALAFPLGQLAEEKGYFAEKGLTVSYNKLENAGSVMYDALSVGKIEAAYAQAVPPISYGAQGYDVTIIGGVVSGGMVAVTKPENYDELKDVQNWGGHSIGVIQMSTSELTIRDALQNEYGIDVDNDISFVMIEDYPSISLSTEKGNVDIGFISNVYVESAIEQGLVVLTTLYDLRPDYVCCRQSAYTKNLEVNRDAYVVYLEGQIKAYKDIYTDEESTKKSLSAATGETEDYIYNRVYNEELTAHQTYNPDPNYNGILGLYEVMLEQDYLESDLTAAQFVDLSVYADALKNVIAENPGDTYYTNMRDYFRENNNKYPDFENLYGDSFWG